MIRSSFAVLRSVLATVAVVGALTASCAAWAKLPPEYGAIVVSAGAGENVRVFDLRAAVENAKASRKPILIYFGAHDCPYCRLLERTFAQHQERLAPKFRQKYVIIEIEGWLRGAKMEFVLPEGQFKFDDFRERLGDDSARFLWPTWYQLDAKLKITRELPPGANEYRELASIEEVFELPN